MIFGINTTSDISKLLYVVSRAFRRVKFETNLEKNNRQAITPLIDKTLDKDSVHTNPGK